MKKLFISAFFILTGIICIAQQPATVKPVKTVIAPIDDKEELTKMKKELIQLLNQYHKQMNAAQSTMIKIEDLQRKFDNKKKELEEKDNLGNFEIQDLMSQYNQAETTTSNVLKKLSGSKTGVIRKID